MTRAVLVSLATAFTVVASTFALDRLVAPSLWFAPVLVTVLVMFGVLVVLRRWTRRMLLPSLGALLAAAATITAWYAHDDALLGLLPTRAAIGTLDRLVGQGVAAVQVALPPIADVPGVGLLVTAGVALLYLLADLLAVPGRAPAWAALPPLALWALPVLLLAPVHGWTIVIAGAGFIAMLATSAEAWREPGGRTSKRRLGALGAVTAAVLAIAVVSAPWVLAIPSPVRWHSPAELADADATRLDLGLDLRSDLNRPEDAVVMTYTGALPSQLGPLHAYTLTGFDGASWDRGTAEEWEPVDDQVLWPGPVDTDGSRDVTITVNDLGQDRLPIPGEPRLVRVDGQASYAPQTDEVRLDQAEPGELTYEVTVRPRDLTAAELRDLDPTTLEVDPALLQLPDTGYGADLTDMTHKIVTDAGAQTPYEQLLAIQNYLRDPGVFTYTESVTSARTRDAVWDFLHDRRGYCVQFGTAMVMMARTLDLPARLAVGYLPGELTEDGTASISAHQAHAWPQVLFPEVGWVRFEPTPGTQSGTAPVWAPEPEEESPEEQTTGPTQTSEPEEETATTSSASAEASEESSESGSADAQGRAGAAFPLLGLLGLGVLLLVGAAVPLLVRRRRARASGDLEVAWLQAVTVVRTAGGRVAPGTTPRAVAAAADEVFAAEPARAALRELAAAVERSRYTRGGQDEAQQPDAQTVREWVQVIRSSGRDHAEGTTGGGQRRDGTRPKEGAGSR